VEDPVNREIKPAQSRNYPEKLFADLRKRPEVGFLIPTILRGTSIVTVINPETKKRKRLDLVPTDQNDPLLLENGGKIPGRNEAILSLAAAEELGLKAGQKIKVQVRRSRDGRREIETLDMTVLAVLNPRADALPRFYARSRFVLDVESYKEGLAVPERNWAGGFPRPYQSFDGFALAAAKPLSRLAQRRLSINTGVTHVTELSKEGYKKKLGYSLPDGWSAYWLYARGNTLQPGVIRGLRNKLRGSGGVLLPVVDKIVLGSESKAGGIRVVGISLSISDSEKLGIPSVPWGQYDLSSPNARITQILTPEPGGGVNKKSLFSAPIIGGKVKFPLTLAGASGGEFSVVPVELLATLRTGADRKIDYDENHQGFTLARGGYRGFRLFARSIDDVMPIWSRFNEMDIPVITQVQAIERVRTLDRGLTRIFWLVAIVGIAGGIAALIANLYAAVERKTQELGVLRLMGISRLLIFRFPIYQGSIVAVLSVVTAFVAYSILATVINQVFAADLNLGQKICDLPVMHFIYTTILTMGAAVFSSMAAAWKTTKIDPAEAIRVE